MEDDILMGIALEEARRGLGMTSPNPMVGAVIVKDGKVVSTGYHAGPGTDHAEVVALNRAGDRADGATLYVNLEPCSHHGRTPPCVRAIIDAHVARVVIAHLDPSPWVDGNGIDALRAAGIDVTVGLCEDRARDLNRAYLTAVTFGRPFIMLKMATTADGRIADRNGQSRWITGAEARVAVQELRRSSDAVMVGIGTVLADDPALTYRGATERSRPLVRVIMDSNARTPSTAMVADVESAPTILITADGSPSETTQLRARGVEVIPVPRNGESGLDLTAVCAVLHEREIRSLLVEGGGLLAGSFLATGLVDEVHWFASASYLGEDAVSACRFPIARTLDDVVRFQPVKTTLVGDDVYSIFRRVD